MISLLIRELDNVSLGGDFRVSRHAGICQFDQLSLEINFKRTCSCNYGIPSLVQVKMKRLQFRIIFTSAQPHGCVEIKHCKLCKFVHMSVFVDF